MRFLTARIQLNMDCFSIDPDYANPPCSQVNWWLKICTPGGPTEIIDGCLAAQVASASNPCCSWVHCSRCERNIIFEFSVTQKDSSLFFTVKWTLKSVGGMGAKLIHIVFRDQCTEDS